MPRARLSWRSRRRDSSRGDSLGPGCCGAPTPQAIGCPWSSRNLRDELWRRGSIADPLAQAGLLLGGELVGRDPAQRLADLRGVLVVDLHLDRLLVAGGIERDRLVLDVDDIRVDRVLVRL